MKKIITLVVVLFLISQATYAQYTEMINSNRPGESETAFSVGTNVAQLELGFALINNEHVPLNYEVGGFGIDFSARYGVWKEELEVSIDGFYQNDTFTNNNSSITTENKRSNFSRLTFGAKYLVFDPFKKFGERKPNLYSYHANQRFNLKSLIPAVSVYLGANYNTENNPYIAPGLEGVSPKIMIATQHNWNGGWVFVTNIIANHLFTTPVNEEELKQIYGEDYSVTEFQYILTLTHAFNPKWVIFAETQGIKSDFYADNLFRLGGAYLFNKDFQIDANYTFNSKDTPTVSNINFGASYRFDFHKDKIERAQQ